VLDTASDSSQAAQTGLAHVAWPRSCTSGTSSSGRGCLPRASPTSASPASAPPTAPRPPQSARQLGLIP